MQLELQHQRCTAKGQEARVAFHQKSSDSTKEIIPQSEGSQPLENRLTRETVIFFLGKNWSSAALGPQQLNAISKPPFCQPPEVSSNLSYSRIPLFSLPLLL